MILFTEMGKLRVGGAGFKMNSDYFFGHVEFGLLFKHSIETIKYVVD